MEEKLAFAARFSSDLFAYISCEGIVELSNRAFRRELVPNQESSDGMSIAEIFGEDKFGQLFELHFAECLEGNQTYTEFNHHSRTGIAKFYGIQFVPFFQNERIESALVLFRDISYIRRLEDKVQLLEYRDRRTGLPNRRSLDLVLKKELAQANRSDEPELKAVLFISLENFAKINQTYGHEIGDILLENTGLRIKETLISEVLRDSDYVFEQSDGFEEQNDEVFETRSGSRSEYRVFRFEGKEFAALLTDIAKATDAAVVAARIVKSVSLPYHDRYGSEIFIECNVGIAVFPDDGKEKDVLVQHAASAMHEAKRLGMEFLLFNPDLHKKAMQKMRLGGSIYNAFIESQFELYYQPIVDSLGEILGAEALIRWNHPEKGVVSPAEFLPLAEEKGIIVNIGKWVLYSVVKQLERWPNDIYVSVNLCARELEHSQLVDNVLRVLDNAPTVDPGQLKIEITETDTMRNPADTLDKMTKLAGRGIDILIDDFGTGYSSLSYLRELPVRALKIDKSFVADIVDDPEERRFLEGIVDLAICRKKSVIIEGVETAEQAGFIREMKPAFMQGFHFCGPVPADVMERFIQRRVHLPIS